MPDRLAGRTALVTGGGNGLGRAMATALAERGVRVVVAGRTASTLEDTSAALGAAGDDVRVVLSTSPIPTSVAALGDAVADEEISILVNNAGVAGPVASAGRRRARRVGRRVRHQRARDVPDVPELFRRR